MDFSPKVQPVQEVKTITNVECKNTFFKTFKKIGNVLNKLHERFAPEIVELQPNNSNISEAKTNYKIHNLFFLIIFKKKKVGVEMAVSSECCMGRRDGEFTTHQPSPPKLPLWLYV